MKKYLVAATCLTLVAGAVFAKKLNNEQKRLEECGVVMATLTLPDVLTTGARDRLRGKFLFQRLPTNWTISAPHIHTCHFPNLRVLLAA